MKAVRIHGYGAAPVMEDVALPAPGPGQVLVRVKAASLNPLDVKLHSGAMHGYFPLAFSYDGNGSFRDGRAGRTGRWLLEAGRRRRGPARPNHRRQSGRVRPLAQRRRWTTRPACRRWPARPGRPCLRSLAWRVDRRPWCMPERVASAVAPFSLPETRVLG